MLDTPHQQPPADDDTPSPVNDTLAPATLAAPDPFSETGEDQAGAGGLAVEKPVAPPFFDYFEFFSYGYLY